METTAVQPTPLGGHQVLRSADLDEAREQIGRFLCSHHLRAHGSTSLDVCHNAVHWRDVSFHYMRYGSEVEIEAQLPETFFLVQIPLRGTAVVDTGPYRCYSDEQRPVVINPHLPLKQTWHAASEKIMLRIRRDAFQAHVDELVGTKTHTPLAFSAVPEDNCPKTSALRRMVLYLISEIDQGRLHDVDTGLMVPQFERTLMSGIIEAIPNNYIDLIGASSREITPRKLRLAEHYMIEHMAQPMTLLDIASAAGTTPRNLQSIFQKFRDTTPMAALRKLRLDEARAQLLASSDGESVTSIAEGCGFSHLGRFSVLYRETFGETPSATLDHGLKCRRIFDVPVSAPGTRLSGNGLTAH